LAVWSVLSGLTLLRVEQHRLRRAQQVCAAQLGDDIRRQRQHVVERQRRGQVAAPSTGACLACSNNARPRKSM
jgi:hypothetical protein